MAIGMSCENPSIFSEMGFVLTTIAMETCDSQYLEAECRCISCVSGHAATISIVKLCKDQDCRRAIQSKVGIETSREPHCQDGTGRVL